MNDAKSLLLLGRQPALGLAELESIYGSQNIHLLNDTVAISKLTVDNIDFKRLGGSIKLADIVGEITSTDWRAIEKSLLKQIPEMATALEPGKIQFGLSVQGLQVNVKDIQATALRLKKAIRTKTNQSVRVTPNQSAMLSSAQILHNRLTGPRGMEIVLVRDGNTMIISRTIAEQDIEAYANRDQKRPKRDARVGMLPPKLAQIIVNLGVGSPLAITDKTTHQPIVLDPFCGTGVVLQEALLMGYHVIGTDIEPRMIEYTQKNMDWLYDTHNIEGFLRYLDDGDATNHSWLEAHSVNAIACEGYLGQPFSAFPAEEKLRDVMQTCNQIMKGFFEKYCRTNRKRHPPLHCPTCLA